MTRAAARKAVRTMRENRESRQRHRWKPSSSKVVDVMMVGKHARMERASRAVHHRKRKKRHKKKH